MAPWYRDTMRCAVLAVLAASLLAACAPPMGPGPAAGDAAPDFALLDVNPGSPTAGQRVGPSTLRGKVSGWYFTHSG